MSIKWNERTLKAPPVNTHCQNPSDLNFSALRKLLVKAMSAYNTSKFDEAAALASRVIARRNNSFRSQYGFKLLKKTNTALRRLKNINIIHVVKNFLAILPEYRLQGKMDLPTKANFEYVLIRLQSLSKILVRISICAKESSVAFCKYIHQGYFLDTCSFYIGLLSEIWDLAKGLCQQTIEFYNELLPYGKYFYSHKKHWLSEEYIFPTHLETFLGDDWTKECLESSVQTIPKLHGSDIFNLNDFINNDAEMISQNIETENTISNKQMEKKKIKKSFHKIEDDFITGEIGTVISRETFDNIFSIDDIENVQDFQKFINDEEKLRKLQNHKKTISIGDNQWADFRRKAIFNITNSRGRVSIQKLRKLYTSAITVD